MATKERKEIAKILNESDIQEDLKERLLEYILTMKREGFNFTNDVIFTVPSLNEKDFYLNKIIDVSMARKRSKSYWEVIDKNLDEKSKYEIEIKHFREPRKQKSQDNNLNQLAKRFENLEEENKKIRGQLNLLKSTIINIVNDLNTDEKIQFIPVDIYIDTNDSQTIFDVYSAVNDLIEHIGFEKNIELEAIKGSWYKKLLAKSKKALSEKEVNDRLKEIEYALEVKVLKDQSEVDKNQSEALSNILKSVENIANAAIKIGSLLVVKVTAETGEASVQVRSLSILELHLLNKRPDLLLKPQEILSALANMLEENNKN